MIASYIVNAIPEITNPWFHTALIDICGTINSSESRGAGALVAVIRNLTESMVTVNGCARGREASRTYNTVPASSAVILGVAVAECVVSSCVPQAFSVVIALRAVTIL